jgi:hypothetical protein
VRAEHDQEFAGERCSRLPWTSGDITTHTSRWEEAKVAIAHTDVGMACDRINTQNLLRPNGSRSRVRTKIGAKGTLNKNILGSECTLKNISMP